MLRNIVLLMAISLAWASNYLFIGMAESSLRPFTMSAMMMGFAAIFLLLIVPFYSRQSLLQTLTSAPLLLIVISLAAITLPEITVVIAEQHITADMASLIGIAVPIFTFIITVFITRSNHYSHLRMAGVAVAVAGVITYIGWDSLLADDSNIIGILIMMSGGLVFALNGILVASRAKDLDLYSLTALVVTISAIILSALALIFERQHFQLPSMQIIYPIAGAGIVSIGLAYLGYFILLGKSSAYFTSLYAYLVPILGVLLGIVFLHEPLSLNHAAGLLIVLFGLWLLIRPTIKG